MTPDNGILTAPPPGVTSNAAAWHHADAAPVDRIPALVSEQARAAGFRDVTIYLADLQQAELVPFQPAATETPEASATELSVLPGASALSVDSTVAGRCFQLGQLMSQDDPPDGRRVWVPLTVSGSRLGVLGLTLDGWDYGFDSDLVSRAHGLALTTAQLLVIKGLTGDALARVHRRRKMNLAAEIQWSLLPPRDFVSDSVTLAGALEPAYDVGGDSIDYAVDSGVARFAVLDGMGHGLASTQLAVVTVGAYRNARRSGYTLLETLTTMDEAVRESFAGEAFTTAVFGELDLASGRLSWVNAGHPDPLLLRSNRVVKHLESEHVLPLGLNEGRLGGSFGGSFDGSVVAVEQLERGDHVLAFTDGVIEGRSTDGTQFGLDRLTDLVTKNLAGGLPPAETMRRLTKALVQHQRGQLRDDASMMLVHWPSA